MLWVNYICRFQNGDIAHLAIFVVFSKIHTFPEKLHTESRLTVIKIKNGSRYYVRFIFQRSCYDGL